MTRRTKRDEYFGSRVRLRGRRPAPHTRQIAHRSTCGTSFDSPEKLIPPAAQRILQRDNHIDSSPLLSPLNPLQRTPVDIRPLREFFLRPPDRRTQARNILTSTIIFPKKQEAKIQALIAAKIKLSPALTSWGTRLQEIRGIGFITACTERDLPRIVRNLCPRDFPPLRM